MVLLLVFLSIGIGVGLVSGELEPGDRYSLEHTGNSENLLPGESTQTITGIEVHGGNEDESSKKVSLYISLLELKNNDVDVSSANIDSTNISNANISDVHKYHSKNDSYIRLDIEHLDPSEPILIHEITLAKLGTESATSPSQVRYELGVAQFDSTVDFDELKSSGNTVESASFRIIAGEIEVPDQATESTRLSGDDRTTGAVSMENVTSNVNSTILITREQEDAEIIGVKSYVNNTSGSQIMSVKTPVLGGKIRAYMIADSYLPSNESEVGDTLSNSTLDTAIASDEAHIMLGAIDFDSEKYYYNNTSNITIDNARLLDAQNDNTPFIISLHPVTVSGNIALNDSIGHSKVLTGRNENIDLITHNASQNGTCLARTDFAAIS